MILQVVNYSKFSFIPITESCIIKIFGMSRVAPKGSAPELDERETDTRVICMADALKHSDLCAITMG